MNNDQQVSQNLQQLNEIHRRHQELARALEQLNEVIDKTYGLSVRLRPKKGIYYIQDGLIEPVETLGSALDQIKNIEFIEKPEPKVKVVYKSKKTLILD